MVVGSALSGRRRRSIIVTISGPGATAFDEPARAGSTLRSGTTATNTSRVATIFPIVEFVTSFVMHPSTAHEERKGPLVMNAPTFAAGPSPDPGFIRFDMFSACRRSCHARAHHPGARLSRVPKAVLHSANSQFR